jgi:hypothetical protein
VLVGDLGDRGHVDHVVETPVAAHGQPAGLFAVAGGGLDRRGAVIRRERVGGGDPRYVGDVADDGGGDDRADAEHAGEAGAGGLDGGSKLLLDLGEHGVDPAQVRQVLAGHVVPGRGHGIGGLVRAEDGGGPVRGDVLGHAAGGDLAQHGVQAAGGLGAQ